MFRFGFYFISVFFCLQTINSQTSVQVFISGTEGYKIFRIPAIVKLPNGDLLAFAEGRTGGISDFGDINIVMKRSSDNGKTWGSVTTVVNYGSLQAGNPAPVIDLTDSKFPEGRIFLFYNTGNASENQVRKGKGLREVWYITSVDGGNSWSDPVNITIQVHRPNYPEINPDYSFAEDWRSYANTPGHALQFQSGKYQGRIYVAANHSQGKPQSHFEEYCSHGYYSDDHGKTFQLSENVPVPGSNEATAAELLDNGLILNARNQSGNIKQRIVAISKNGGQTWDTVYFDKNLSDPVNQGSILNLKSEKGKNILAFCNAADTIERDNLTLRISFDEGKTWIKSFLIDKNNCGRKIDGYTAYSDIVKINDKQIGVLYERDNYSEIVFKVMNCKY